MSATAPTASPGAAQSVVRRIVVFVILFALVVVAATGVSGLIERVIGAGRALTTDDSGLALSLAFALIGAPLAGVLWWWERRRLASDPAERASLVWSLYLLRDDPALADHRRDVPGGCARRGDRRRVPAGRAVHRDRLPRRVGVAPAHAAQRRHSPHPTRGCARSNSPRSSGSSSPHPRAIDAIAQPIAQALAGMSFVMTGSQYWVISTLQALIWCAIGALVWWWHWFRERAKDAPGALAAVLLVIVVGAAAATTLFAIGTALFVVLRLLFDTDPFAQIVASLDVAIAAGLIGGIVWVYHARVLAGRSVRARRSGRLVISAIALIGAASGFGVIVNALLASFGGTLIQDDPRTLLLGGISALVVGAPVWWLAWRPAREVTADEAADPSRRVYLVVVFGASAIVAIVTLLIIGYRLFEFGLDGGGAGGLIERIRAPFGLLSATAIVFGYHFAIWRRDRAAAGTIVRRQAIGRVFLVTSGDAGELASLLHEETGAAVTVWRAADDSGDARRRGSSRRARPCSTGSPRLGSS